MGQQASHETLPGIYANNIIHPPLLPLRAEAVSTGALPDPCARREIQQGMGEEEERPLGMPVGYGSWCFPAIYASPRFYERYILWDNLVKVAEVNTIPWVVTEDFDEMLLNSEKFGGRLVSTHRSLLFKEYIDTCNLVDIGFSAPKYTWTNKREVLDLI